MQRFKKLDVGLTGAEEGVQDAEYALRDGLQAHDEPAIRAALTQIRAHLAVIEDVGLDIDAARRALSVGREAVCDKRFAARDRRLVEVLTHYTAVFRQRRNGSRALEVRKSR
jgi:hypothetical protein